MEGAKNIAIKEYSKVKGPSVGQERPLRRADKWVLREEEGRSVGRKNKKDRWRLKISVRGD